MAKLSLLRTDPAREIDGVLFDFELGIRLKIARWLNPRHEEVLAKLKEPRIAEIRAGTISDDDIERLHMEAAAEAVLLDWENVQNDDGTPLKYSPAVGMKTFLDPNLHDLWTFVRFCASQSARYREQAREDSAKNSRAA